MTFAILIFFCLITTNGWANPLIIRPPNKPIQKFAIVSHRMNAPKIIDGGWKPIFYPTDMLTKDNKFIESRQKQIQDKIAYETNIMKPIHSKIYKNDTTQSLNKQNVSPRTLYAKEIKNHTNIHNEIMYKNVNSTILTNPRVFVEDKQVKNATAAHFSDVDTLNRKLQKTLEAFTAKFNKMLENVVQETVKRISINHTAQGQSGSSLTEAGYERGDIDAGTLNYRHIEPNGKSVLVNLKSNETNSKNKRTTIFLNNTHPLIGDETKVATRFTKSIQPSWFSRPYLGYNSPQHQPPDPFVALFLSHYGKYLPAGHGIASQYRNLYSYLAGNDIHNNMPFGQYKIYEDTY